MIQAKLNNGERIWFEDGWIFFEDKAGKFDETSGQSLAKDTLDYRYTHGGKLYRKACEIFWGKLEK